MISLSLPDGWLEACKASENRMKNETPIEPVFTSFCIDKNCPAAKVYTNETPFGMMVNVICMFSKCIRRYPSRKEMKYFMKNDQKQRKDGEKTTKMVKNEAKVVEK